jgi:hypothetical protein
MLRYAIPEGGISVQEGGRRIPGAPNNYYKLVAIFDECGILHDKIPLRGTPDGGKYVLESEVTSYLTGNPGSLGLQESPRPRSDLMVLHRFFRLLYGRPGIPDSLNDFYGLVRKGEVADYLGIEFKGRKIFVRGARTYLAEIGIGKPSASKPVTVHAEIMSEHEPVKIYDKPERVHETIILGGDDMLLPDFLVATAGKPGLPKTKLGVYLRLNNGKLPGYVKKEKIGGRVVVRNGKRYINESEAGWSVQPAGAAETPVKAESESVKTVMATEPHPTIDISEYTIAGGGVLAYDLVQHRLIDGIPDTIYDFLAERDKPGSTLSSLKLRTITFRGRRLLVVNGVPEFNEMFGRYDPSVKIEPEVSRRQFTSVYLKEPARPPERVPEPEPPAVHDKKGGKKPGKSEKSGSGDGGFDAAVDVLVTQRARDLIKQKRKEDALLETEKRKAKQYALPPEDPLRAYELESVYGRMERLVTSYPLMRKTVYRIMGNGKPATPEGSKLVGAISHAAEGRLAGHMKEECFQKGFKGVIDGLIGMDRGRPPERAAAFMRILNNEPAEAVRHLQKLEMIMSGSDGDNLFPVDVFLQNPEIDTPRRKAAPSFQDLHKRKKSRRAAGYGKR